MPVSLKPPKESHGRARRALKQFLELRQDHELLGQVPPQVFNAEFLQSLPVYSLRIGPRHRKSLRREAQRIAWLYLLQHNSRTVALEVAIEDGRHRYARFHQGGLMDKVWDSVSKIRRRRAAGVRDAHIRLLRIYQLHVSCLWLYGKTDTLVPINALPSHLEAGIDYSQEDFMDRVNEAVKSMLALRIEHTPKRKSHRRG